MRATAAFYRVERERCPRKGGVRAEDEVERTVAAQLLDFVRTGRKEPLGARRLHRAAKIMWATDYPHQDGFFPGAPQLIRKQLSSLSNEAKHQVRTGGALCFYGLS